MTVLLNYASCVVEHVAFVFTLHKALVLALVLASLAKNRVVVGLIGDPRDGYFRLLRVCLGFA